MIDQFDITAFLRSINTPDEDPETSSLDGATEDATERELHIVPVQQRLTHGQLEYGGTSLRRPRRELLHEIQEERPDVGGSGVIATGALPRPIRPRRSEPRRALDPTERRDREEHGGLPARAATRCRFSTPRTGVRHDRPASHRRSARRRRRRRTRRPRRTTRSAAQTRLKPATVTPDRWLTAKEAASYLGITTTALHKHTSARTIPFEQDGPGCKLYFRAAELDDWRRGIYPRNDGNGSSTLPKRFQARQNGAQGR